jgi:hypothetical protein
MTVELGSVHPSAGPAALRAPAAGSRASASHE